MNVDFFALFQKKNSTFYKIVTDLSILIQKWSCNVLRIYYRVVKVIFQKIWATCFSSYFRKSLDALTKYSTKYEKIKDFEKLGNYFENNSYFFLTIIMRHYFVFEVVFQSWCVLGCRGWSLWCSRAPLVAAGACRESQSGPVETPPKITHPLWKTFSQKLKTYHIIAKPRGDCISEILKNER